MKILKTAYLPGIILFTFSVFICLITYKDRGLCWDEPGQRDIGYTSYNYIFNGDDSLLRYNAREHGVGFEIPLIYGEKLFKLKTTTHIFYMRHLVGNLFFLISAFFGYILILKLFKSRFIACIGFLMLAFMPRIYAHSFFNTKDVPFLSMILISLTLCQLAFENKKHLWFIILGLACGYTTSIRVMGIILVPPILVFLAIDYLIALKEKSNANKNLINITFFLFSFSLILYATWPILWENPLHSFLEMYNRMSHFTIWNGSVLLNGIYIPAKELSWSYFPTWFLISTPLFTIFSGIIGILWIAIDFIRKPAVYYSNTSERNFLLYLLCFFTPVIAVIYLHSIIYDDWRHLYFVYPPFVLLGLFFVNKIYTSKFKRIIQVLCVAQVLSTGVFMFKYHPFQQVYFNRLVSHDAEFLRKNFDMDYWGPSYKDGLKYLLAHNKSDSIKITGNSYLIAINADFLDVSESEKKRLIILEGENNPEADYMITNFRWHPGDYNYPVFYNIKVLNSTIMCIYKLH